MTRRVYILVPGILTSPSDNSAWCVRMADDIMRSYEATRPCATEFRYYAGALTRRLKQARHARQLASVVDKWGREGFDIVLVGHSNGCDLIERTIKLIGVPIYSLHLIAAASSRDFCSNGYIERLLCSSIHEINVYFSASDSVLSGLARASQVFRFLGLGYGRLGELGPVNVPGSMIGAGVKLHCKSYMDHSDWFNDEHYGNTMRAITALESSD